MGAAAELRILVVDDDEEAQRWIKRVLEAAGYDVIQASSGAAALESADKERIDLILLDIHMPGSDGRDVLRRLKASSSADVPVLIHSGSNSIYDRRLVLELGAEDFLEKPVSPSSLILRIRSLLRRAQDRTANKLNPV